MSGSRSPSRENPPFGRGSIDASDRAGETPGTQAAEPAGTMLYRFRRMPGPTEIPDRLNTTGPPAVGSLWITASAATVDEFHYEALPPVFVAVIAADEAEGTTWLRCVPFGLDESEARPTEIVIAAAESSLGLALRFEIVHDLRLRREQLGRSVGQIAPEALAELRDAIAGEPAPERRGTSPADPIAIAGRADPPVLMVLQQPWWNATGRGPG